MPTHIRALCSWQSNSMLPKDVHQITPCFRHQQILPVEGGPEWDTLANDLINGLDTWDITSSTHEMKVRLYEIGGAKPNRPKATVTKYPGVSAALPVPPELAICLSFSGGPNAPHNRGRLYIPYWCVSSSSPGERPTGTNQTKVGALVPLFAGLGGVDVDWIVWSPTRTQATKVERWFVDDEWDVQRRRGYRPLTRTSGTTGG